MQRSGVFRFSLATGEKQCVRGRGGERDIDWHRIWCGTPGRHCAERLGKQSGSGVRYIYSREKTQYLHWKNSMDDSTESPKIVREIPRVP